MSPRPTGAPHASPRGLPRRTTLRALDTHRLIPARFSDHSVLADLAPTDDDLRALFELEAFTNDRVRGERDGLAGIGPDELLAGVPYAHIVNAAFCHPHPEGGRFNGPGRGAWYAAFEIETAQAEVAFHRTVQLAEIDWRERTTATWVEYLSDVSGSLHDIREDARFASCLRPDSYVRGQALAARLLEAGSLGILYPSVRRAGGTCLACFRPAVVTHVRPARAWRFTWEDGRLQGIRAVAASRRSV